MSDRIERIIPEAPKNYEAWLYEIRIWKTPKYFKKYGGYHKGIFESDEDNYFHSSEDIYMRHDFAFEQKIEYEILDYGTASDMGYKEKKMLTDVDNGKGKKRGAADSDDWYNNHNGGGINSKGYKGMGIVNEVWEHIRWVVDDNITGKNIKQYLKVTDGVEIRLNKDKSVYLSTDYADSIYLQKLTGRNNPYQPRTRAYITDAVIRYKEIFDSGQVTPKEWKPIVLLMPKKGSIDPKTGKEELPYIIGGNLSSLAVSLSKHGHGLYYIGIPFEIWGNGKMSESNIKTWGNRLNSLYQIDERETLHEDDSRDWIIEHCEDNNLYRTTDTGIIVLDKNHASINDELVRCGWKSKSKRDTIKRSAQSEYERKHMRGDHLVDFSKDGLSVNLELAEGYKKKTDKYLKKNGGDYDLVFKMSGANINLFKFMRALWKVDPETGQEVFRKYIRFYVYFKNTDQWDEFHKSDSKKEYLKNSKGEKVKNNSLVGRKELDFLIEKHFTHQKIDVRYLPVSRKEAEIEGWIKPN